MKILLSTILLFAYTVSFSQSNIDSGKNFTVSGQFVLDSLNGAAASQATVSIKKDEKIIKTTVADKAGLYKFIDLILGEYEIAVAYSGYETFNQKISLVADVQLAIIVLNKKSTILSGVTVTSQKSIIENKIDKLVYNVDRDVTSQGGVATDILRKIPQVTVDVNGNVELLGNPSVRFLINGKPSTMFGNSVADALQSIPAAQIQSIEVISSPGAKYDASGTGGIINIIMKKNKSQGVSGNINVTAGTRQENGSFNLSYKKNSFSLNSFFSGGAQLTVKTLSTLNRNSVDTALLNTFQLQQQGYSNFNRGGYRTGVGMDWDFSEKDNLSASVSYNQFHNNNNGAVDLTNTQKDKNGIIYGQQNSIRNSTSTFKNGNIDANIDYKRKFKKENQELGISVNISTDNDNTYYLQQQADAVTKNIFSGSTSRNPGKDFAGELLIDYTHPLKNEAYFETGINIETEKLVSNANVLSYSTAQSEFIVDPIQSYQSTFNRQVYAAYVSATYKVLKTFTVISGLRFEHTVNRAWYSNASNVNIPDYNNLAPSITIAHNFTEDKILKFTYSYRIERPEYRDLNPFVNLADPYNITTGNPLIKPELGRNYQLGYTQNFNNENNLNIILQYTFNSPDIKSYTTFYPSYKVNDSIYSNVNVTRRDNIASETRWGLNINSSITIAKKLSMRPSLQLYERRINNLFAIPQRQSGFEYRGNLNMNYQFSKTLVAEVFGNYRSGIRWQGKTAGFYSYSAAVRKQILKNKASIGLVAVNAFGKYLLQKTIQNGVGFTGNTELRIPYRSFGINFLYKFGKLKQPKAKEEDNLLAKPPVE